MATYKYLGLTISTTHYTEHLKLTTTLMKMMGAQIKAIARQSLDRPKEAHVLWRLAEQPVLLHGAEVVQYTKTWLKQAEAGQMNIAKWCLGVHKSTSTTVPQLPEKSDNGSPWRSNHTWGRYATG